MQWKNYILRIPILPMVGPIMARDLGSHPLEPCGIPLRDGRLGGEGVPTPFPKEIWVVPDFHRFPCLEHNYPNKNCNLPDPEIKPCGGWISPWVFFSMFSHKKGYLKTGNGYHLSSVVRQGEGRPSKPSLDYPPPAASDGYDYFSWGAENGSAAVGEKGW